MDKKKIIIAAIAFLLGLIIGAPIVNYASTKLSKTIEVVTGINIEVNGEKFTPKDENGKKVDVFLYDGTTYVPIRAISTIYESDIDWDGESKTVSLFKKVVANASKPKQVELITHKVNENIDMSKIKKGEQLNLADYKEELKVLISQLEKIDKDFDINKYKFFANMYTESGEDGMISLQYFIGDKIETNKEYVAIVDNNKITKISDSFKTLNPNAKALSKEQEQAMIEKVDKFIKSRENIDKQKSSEKIDERRTKILYDYTTKQLKYIDTKFIISEEMDGAIVPKTVEIVIE